LFLFAAGSWRFGEFISWMLWINSGFFSLGSMADEIVDPKRTYVMATALLVPLVVVFNAVPQAIAMSLESDQAKFQAGLFGTLAGDLAGPWLSILFVIASNVCLIGLHNSTIISAERAVAFIIPASRKFQCDVQRGLLFKLKTWLFVEAPQLGVPRAHIIGCTGGSLLPSFPSHPPSSAVTCISQSHRNQLTALHHVLPAARAIINAALCSFLPVPRPTVLQNGCTKLVPPVSFFCNQPPPPFPPSSSVCLWPPL
jgi:hypothetical protein